MMDYDTANRISTKTTKAIIGAMGLNRQAPRVLAFAPPSKLGLGMQHHYMVQGTKHVKQIVSHVRQQDDNGKLYQATFDHSQLVAGVTTPLLQYPSRQITYFDDPFVTGVRKFLEKTEMNIVLTQLHVPKKLREGDLAIMNELLQTKTTKRELRYFNQCRLFFQVFWLSEICEPDGKSLDRTFMDFTKLHTLPSFSNLRWPYQPTLSRKTFATWKKLVRQVFLATKQGNSRDMKLDQPLGQFFA
jgi:hypothetical protein